MNEVKLNGNRFSLIRERDGAGDSGNMFNCINHESEEITHGEIKVGCSVQCGTHFARTIQWQDWWLTTPVSEIISVNDDQTEVKFKTTNSIYIAKAW